MIHSSSLFIKILVVATILICGTACEMVVDMNIPEHKPKLALQLLIGNYLQPDYFILFLGHSQSILSQENLSGVENATIEIKDASGTIVEKFEPTLNGSYKPSLSFVATPGLLYKLYASAPGFDPIEASTVIPFAVPLFNSSLNITGLDEYGRKKGYITTSFHDEGNTENYYYLSAQLLDSLGNFIGRVSLDDDENDGVEGVVQEAQFFYTFSDQTFNGQSPRILNHVLIPEYIRNFDGFTYRPKSVLIELHHLSRDEYLFRKSMEEYELAQGNPFAEPARVYSNIKNGYGVFSSSAKTTFVIPLP